jgi:ATP adenylyltransferase
MDILWAGWRAGYIRGVDDGDPVCLFCRLPGEDDAAALILQRAAGVYSVLNRYPYTTGHLMIAPYRHVADPEELDADERAAIWAVLADAKAACTRALSPQGFNLGANLGRVAGAGVPGHLHLHLVPRWAGDTNFMTPIGGSRVIPEDLADTWEALRAALGRH